jgi:hypothetical protein
MGGLSVRRAAFLLLFAGITGCSVQVLIAQSPDQPLHAPSGGVQWSFASIFVPPVAGAPFTATVTTEWKRTLDDGSTVTIGNRRTIARDGTGRVFQERRYVLPAGDPRENQINRLEFADPRAHTITSCWPTARICQVNYYFAPTGETPPSSTGPLNGGKGFLTRLDLGSDLVSGVETIGTRETTTLEAGTIGNDRAISIVKEFWYSQQLRINVIEKRRDPSYGTQVFTVSPINLGEPDATLFDIPADFRIDDKRTPN